ncbi:MAG: shikimate dehydrogenase [Clostridiales bacterium]
MKYGLIGETLGHSVSPYIHKLYGNDDYVLKNIPHNEVVDFIKSKNYLGLNVTIPYKETVLPLCDEISPGAKKIGSVNTLILRSDNTLYGENTDLFGFIYMAKKANISFQDKKVIIMGTGGTGKMAKVAAAEMEAREIVQISRNGDITYEDKEKYLDGDILVNTTPVGMYPNNGKQLVDLQEFSNLKGVLDVVYNPLRTALVLQAEDLKIPHTGGLTMLTEQARYAGELFLHKKIPQAMGDEACKKMRQKLANIIIVNSERIAASLGKELNREVITQGNWEEIAKEKSLILSVSKKDAEIYYNTFRQNGVLFPAGTIKRDTAATVEAILRSL